MAKRHAEAHGLIAQLQEAIRESGKSLYQLSKECGVARPQLSRFMRGERTLTLPAAEKICEALRLDLTPREEGEGREAGPVEPETPTARKGRGRK